MAVIKSRNPIADEVFYNDAAGEYCASLAPEHFMESTVSATQREITLESFRLIRPHRPDVHCFNELLIQYPVTGIHDLARVVPDNMVVVHDGPIRARKSFNIPFEQARPFLVLEYVSEDSRRKDYADNLIRYERDLKVPYYLLFEPEKKELILFHLPARRRKFTSVRPTASGRFAIPELELEVGLEGEWVRFWFRGRFLPLSDVLDQQREAAERRAAEERAGREAAERRAAEERAGREAAEAEVERLKAELSRLRGGGA